MTIPTIPFGSTGDLSLLPLHPRRRRTLSPPSQEQPDRTRGACRCGTAVDQTQADAAIVHRHRERDLTLS